MPDGNQIESSVLTRSHTQDPPVGHIITAGPDRRTSSVSSRSHRPSPTPSHDSNNTPLTPEESPPFRTTRKRTTGIVEQEDKDLDSNEGTPAHSRANSGDSIHVCICQPDPKIPRPRNAFILYRQHYQAQVVSEHQGLANPEISKIIGLRWQNETPETKSKWKALAEEEKLRHQAQYPTYRYQPKRSGRRTSLSGDTPTSAIEKAKCTKCGGKTILAPSTPYTHFQSYGSSPSGSHTPASANTPVSRTLPVLRDLSLQSPAVRRSLAKQYPSGIMSPGRHPDDRDDLGPLSPDTKRRRFNGDPSSNFNRSMPQRYVTVPQHGPQPVGPGTPFPFGQNPPHPYPAGANGHHLRRESLPGLQGMINSPGPMPPPPRPVMGYQQHRLSQGGPPHDRSLTLPPLKTGGPPGPPGPSTASTPSTGKSVTDQIMSMEFWHKVKVLSQVAPPVPVQPSAPRGPLLVIEGDNPDAVKDLGAWLSKTLSKSDDLNVTLVDGPAVVVEAGKQKIMSRYHRLTADWLDKSGEILESLSMKPASSGVDSVMADATPTQASKTSSRTIEEKYDESDDSPKPVTRSSADSGKSQEAGRMDSAASSNMDVDSGSTSSANSGKEMSSAATSTKPVSLIANYSLFASNFFACHIPITAHDPYSPLDHWTWTATQWRGIVSPDLTIYVRDSVSGSEGGKASVEIMADGNLFSVKRTKIEGKDELEIEPSVLRRLGFEVSEWVRAFGNGAE
ncbi:hypothetical protein TI39_contig4153g00002 [Zymoseptoria brevis]|uniref:HMG box domain-containing protein n=1 Tax=Zymoseptoria brevis TaxID=1047168 RepID=A0A0F4GBW0_9PEZI|nr:hypothetical protein TI39_contig4153g00002 [Zymoseptoria brevis]